MTTSVQQCLLTVYQLDPEANGIALSDVAEHMQVNLSSAYSAVKELASLGFVTKNGRRMVFLTVAGRKEAAHLSSRYATIEQFLVDILGVAPEAAFKAATAMDEALSAAG